MALTSRWSSISTSPPRLQWRAADLTKYGANDVKSQFADTAWSQATQGSDAVYGYPQDTGDGALLQRRYLCESRHHDIPATWDEYAADAVKIHASGPDYYIATYPPRAPAGTRP
jgi:multiple sugar transport system substrate-binding protein